MDIDAEDGKWDSLDKVLARSGPLEGEDFPASEETRDYLEAIKVLVIGAGGLGCEVLKGLALSGFQDIEVVDNDTIELSNLNRQFLFRKRDVGSTKAECAANFVMKRVQGVTIKPTVGLIQDQPLEWYKTFQIIICGLDNVEARRWINDLLLNFVRFDENGDADMETVIPLIDGGTEGFKGHCRVIVPGVTADMACGPEFAEDAGVPLCTIKNTPRIADHCILYASVVMWEKEKPFDGAAMDTDNMEHMQWLYEHAAARAKAFNIPGVTQMHTLGVVKNIIPAITSINAIVAANSVNEALKLATNCYKHMDSFMMYNGKDGVYTYTYPVERLQAKGHPAFPLAVINLSVTGDTTLETLRTKIVNSEVKTFSGQVYKLQTPNLKTLSTRLYSTAPAFEEMDIPNLSCTLDALGVKDGDRIFISEPGVLPKDVNVWVDLSFA